MCVSKNGAINFIRCKGQRLWLLGLVSLARVVASHQRCDQTPVGTTVPPTVDNDVPFRLLMESRGTEGKYLPSQTYVLKLETRNESRPFKQFMITAEDPDVAPTEYSSEGILEEVVGKFKTLDDGGKNTMHSERCANSVENAELSYKTSVEVHWISPKQREGHQKIRFRAMVAENSDKWYEGGNLTKVLEKDDAKPLDSAPWEPILECILCSEARYEMIFKGQWSRGSHPRHYPSKPDDNYYSHVIGASHDYGYELWMQGSKASEGLALLAEEANSTVLERWIINTTSTGGSRTLIKGRSRRHPDMSEPTHALFRVDKIHHLFSIAVAMKPSPDWFLGTSKFELCSDSGWLSYAQIPLFPWDAGTRDGISYESPTSSTQPVGTVERVAVGSFDKDSPFFNMNLGDLKPFALLEVRRIDVYPLDGEDCSPAEAEGGIRYQTDEVSADQETPEEPQDLASRLRPEGPEECNSITGWSEWSRCVARNGICGPGVQVRARASRNKDSYYDEDQSVPVGECREDPNAPMTERRVCFVECS